MTIKEQLIRDINKMSDSEHLITIETLETGEYNEMLFLTSKEMTLEYIETGFNESLFGKIPSGVLTTIEGWRFITSYNNIE